MANSLFNYDSKVIRFGNKLTDLMILQLFTILFSVPIFTIGASFTAMHSVLLKLYRNQDPIVYREFWKAFKANFKQSTLIWLIYLGFLLFMAVDLYIVFLSKDGFLRLLIYALPIPILLGLMSMCWVFVLQSRYENTLIATIKHSFLMVLHHPVQSFCMLVLFTLPIWLSYITWFSLPFILLLGFSGPGFLRAILYSMIFDRIEGRNWRKEQDN